MSLKAWGGALALLLVAQGCDKLRSLPGLELAPVVPAPPPPPVSMGPWLLNPLPGQMTVAWTTLEPSVGRVWYGSPEPDRLATEDGQASTDHRVVLPSLPPGTQVRYRIDGATETGWFTSAPKQDGEGPIQVLIYGDNRTYNGDHALVARAAAAEHPQLLLHTGDMVVNAREEPLWRVWFQEEHDLVAHAPILATVGDHEITDNGAAYSKFFQHRDRRAYWSTDYGPVHIVVLDSFETSAGATRQRRPVGCARPLLRHRTGVRLPHQRESEGHRRQGHRRLHAGGLLHPLQRSRLGRIGPGGKRRAGRRAGEWPGRLAPQAPPQTAPGVGRERRRGRGEPAPMRITDMFRFAAERGEPVFSFEFFPPKNDAGVASLFESLRALRPLGPSFVSVTWGAGGSSRGRTLEMVTRIKRDTEIEAMAHLTCVGASRKELEEQLGVICDAGISNVLALRGDPPRGQREFVAHPDGLAHASDLVLLAREVADKRGVKLCIGAACYPEGHPETRDLVQDLRHCKSKVDAGADFLITQLFFDNRSYFQFVGRARAAGIEVPILPGIMPITNVDQIERFTAMCGAHLPSGLSAALRARRDEPDAALQLGVAYAALQCADLLKGGAPGVHFYTLNRSTATRAILAALRAQEPWREA